MSTLKSCQRKTYGSYRFMIKLVEKESIGKKNNLLILLNFIQYLFIDITNDFDEMNEK